MKLLSHLEKRFECWFLIGISIVFFFLRLPSLFEPHWYGDEGIYQAMGLAISKGALLYKEIWDNKPPLLYVLYGIFAGDQFSLRALSIVFGLISVFIFYILSKKIFASLTHLSQKTQEHASYISTTLFAILFATPLLEGNIANAENFMIAPILAAGYLIFTTHTLKERKTLLLAGALSAIAFLFKIVGIFDFAAFTVFLAIAHFTREKNPIALTIHVFPYVIGFITPVIIVSLYFLLRGTFPEFYQGAFTQMVGYVGYGNYFLIPQGLLIVKTLLLALFLLLLFLKRNSIPTGVLFILCWLSFSLFNTFFAGRPYIHYLLVLVSSFSLYSGYVFAEKKSIANKGILILVLLAIFNTFRLYNKPVDYYFNFLSFITSQKNVTDYYSFFDRNTPRDYQLVQFIAMNTKTTDTIFVWGNNAQIYKMSNKLPPGRFTVAYHITATSNTLEETHKALAIHQPKLIIVVSPSNPFPYSLMGYTHRINIGQSLLYERIY